MIQYSAHDRKGRIQRLGLYAISLPLRDERLQAAHTHLLQFQPAYKQVQLFQMEYIIRDALALA